MIFHLHFAHKNSAEQIEQNKTGQFALIRSLSGEVGRTQTVAAESHMNVLATPGGSAVEAGHPFNPEWNYDKKEEPKIGDESMKMSSILDKTRESFTCPDCSTKTYWETVDFEKHIKCKYCGKELEKSPDGSVIPSEGAATDQPANVTGSDHSSQWASTESEAEKS